MCPARSNPLSHNHHVRTWRVQWTHPFVLLHCNLFLSRRGLAVNLGFEGVHRVLEHYSREGPRDVDFLRGLAGARNMHNAGAKASEPT